MVCIREDGTQETWKDSRANQKELLVDGASGGHSACELAVGGSQSGSQRINSLGLHRTPAVCWTLMGL